MSRDYNYNVDTVQSLQQLLDDIDAGIAKIISTGQSTSIDTGANSIRITRANITEMRRYREDVYARLLRLQSGGGTVSVNAL